MSSASNLMWYLNKHAALVADLKVSARKLTRRLIEAGYVRPRPEHCERCGQPPPEGQVVHAHHVNYLRPELIAWLCPSCHRSEHNAIDWAKLWSDADHAA